VSAEDSKTNQTLPIIMSTTAQKKRTPAPLETDDVPLTIDLRVIPAEDWHRTWTTCRTIMLTITSKGVRFEATRGDDRQVSHRHTLATFAFHFILNVIGLAQVQSLAVVLGQYPALVTSISATIA
jgi:hypothetical protein